MSDWPVLISNELQVRGTVSLKKILATPLAIYLFAIESVGF
jgi:hypothetical protein